MSADKGIDRRGFLGSAIGVASGACLLGLGLASVSRRGAEAKGVALRPPGALAEADFLSACLRCGLCVRDCPYHTLTLSDGGQGVAVGTPVFEARSIACEM